MAKRQNKSGIRQHIERIRPHVKLPVLFVIAVLLIIVALFVMGVKLPFSQSGGENLIDKKVSDYIELYLGFINVTVLNKTMANDIWTVSVSAHAPDGIVFIDVLMDGRDFSVVRIFQSIDLPSRPNTIIDLGKDIGCTVGDKITTDIYIDPYDPWTRRHDYLITGFAAKFQDNVRLSYRIIPTFSFDAAKDPTSDVMHALRYLECAKDTQYFDKVKGCVYSKYEEKQEFLTENETRACVSEAGMDVTKATECANGVEAINALSIDDRFANTFLGNAMTPTVVIDCRYKTFPMFVDKAFCYLYPGTGACKETAQ